MICVESIITWAYCRNFDFRRIGLVILCACFLVGETLQLSYTKWTHKKLQIWQESIALIPEVYALTTTLPDYEKFGLRTQMNRCSVSIASNISEGTSKRTDKHFAKYLDDSLGSAFELETQLIVCKNLNFMSEEKFKYLENQVQRLQQKISNFIDKLDK